MRNADGIRDSRSGHYPAPEPADCLAGGGEMGALMRSFDWAKTPLGPVASWPQSLRTTVSTCLNSRFPILVWWGPQMVKLYNDGYATILGVKHPAALGRPGREVWPEIWDLIGPMLEGVLERGEATWSENILLPLERHGFAEECYFTFSYSPIRNEAGRIGGIFTAVTETTGQVLSERRLRTLHHLSEVTAASSSVAATLDAVCGAFSAEVPELPFFVLYHFDAGQVRVAGAAGLASAASRAVTVEALLGLAGRGVLGVDDAAELLDIAPRTTHAPQRAIALPVPRAGSDDAYGVLVCGLSPMLAFDARYEEFLRLLAKQVGTSLDTARAAEDARRRAEALAEIDRAKTAFFSNVSHEFRTPLTLMLGPMEDALAKGGLYGEDLEIAFRNVLRLQKLVNALLDFSRIEAGRMCASYVPTDLSRFTRELTGMFESAMQRAGLRFLVRVDAIGEAVYVDHDMYEKIVLNLLSNALKYTFEGEIEVGLRDSGGTVELAVRDTGVGVAPEEIPRLFERFHRIEGARARTHEGSGIGLALVSDLVKLHGGRIDVTSAPGHGTTFVVRLPKGTHHLPPQQLRGEESEAAASATSAAFVEEALRWLPGGNGVADAHPEAAAVRPAAASGAERPAAVLAARQRLLVVDDNADMRNYLQRILAPRWQVETAADGIAALEAARHAPPDLVLTDVMMPNLDGFGLLRALRADARTQAVPVVMLSARAGEESHVEGLQAGADDYIIKPFSARELVARVQTHLELSRLRRHADLQTLKLSALLEQAPAIICVLAGPDHIYRLANSRYHAVVGDRPLMGLPIRAALPELAGQGIFELLDQAYASGEPVIRGELPLKLQRRGTLEDTWWNFVYQPYRDAEGRVEGVMVLAFEITMQVQARAQAEALSRRLAASEAALRESEQQFRTLADTIPLLAWYANADGHVAWYNRRWYEYTGTTLETQEGWQWQSAHDPADLPRVVAKWKAALASGEPWEDEFRLRRHDGELRWFLSRAIPLRDAPGRIVRWFGTNVDIEDQKRAAAAAEAASRTKDEFLAMLGHELRNPLAPIMTALHLMRLRDGEHGAWERAVIERQAHHMVRLVDDLLDVSRITRGKVQLKKQRIEVAQAVGRAIEIASPLLEQRHHELVVEVASRGLMIDADPERLAQVISNLLTNAAKYTEQGGRITVAAHRRDRTITISVTDTGIGIAPEMLPRVFEMFAQERQALDRAQGGLGLGLAIVRSLVALHGGTVEGRSEGRGCGAEFVVRLPAVSIGEPAASGRSPPAPHAREAAGNGTRVLVVDDNEDAADMLAESLRLYGYTVQVALDGPSALKLVAGFPPHVALLDIGLPVMDGYELARRLRELPGLEKMRLIAVTGYGLDGDRQRSRAAGFDAHLVKPINAELLESVVKTLATVQCRDPIDA